MDESYLSSSPSIPEEEIDFQYVYALRTFTATEQGQATALKGDAMILLNDSNSYWWLVRLVKDGTVGFLPAEHVETPSERLARLNKHRNGDVSSASFSVLKKHQDKQTKNKPKKKRKTVSFKQVYISSDEDDDDDVGLVDDIVEFSDFSEAEESLLEDPENNNIIINGSSISIDSTTSSIMSAKSVEVKQVVVINNASTSTNHESSINDNNNNSNNHLENSTIDSTSRNNNNDDTDSSDDDSDEELMIPSKIKKNSLLNAKSSTENLLRRKTSAASISSSSSVSNHSLASGSTTDSSPTSSPEMFSASSHKLHPQIIPIYKETSIKLDQISSVSGRFLQLSSMARILIFFNFFFRNWMRCWGLINETIDTRCITVSFWSGCLWGFKEISYGLDNLRGPISYHLNALYFMKQFLLLLLFGVRYHSRYHKPPNKASSLPFSNFFFICPCAYDAKMGRHVSYPGTNN